MTSKRISIIGTSPLWNYALILTIIIATLWRYALPIRDGDIFFHLSYAKYFLQNATIIPDHAIFSWTPATNDSIYCTWLADLIFYAIFKIFGYPGFFAIRYIAIFTIFAGSLVFAKKKNLFLNPLVLFACFLFCMLSYNGSTAKPSLFSYFFLGCFTYIWFNLRINPIQSWRTVYLFPVIMLFWVNSHGCFIFGCIFILLINLGELINTWLCPHNCLDFRARKHLVVASILSALSILATPYGYHYPAQLIEENILHAAATSVGISFVGEFKGLFVSNANDTVGYILLGNIAVILLIIALFKNIKHIDWSLLLLNIIFLIFFSRYSRLASYWPIIFVFSYIYLSSQTKIRLPTSKANSLFLFIPPVTLFTTLIIFLTLWYRFTVQPTFADHTGFGLNAMMPVEETEYIKKYFPEAKIGNTYNQGSYLIWNLWPKNRVYVDSRYFPYKNWFKQDFVFQLEGEALNNFTHTYKADIWLLDLYQVQMQDYLLKSADWQLAFNGTSATLFVRSNLNIPEHAPRKSKRFSDMLNFQFALQKLLFVVSINDFETAYEILRGMKKHYHLLPQQRKRVLDVESFVDASVKYNNKEYRKSLEILSKASQIAIDNKPIQAKILVHLAVESWRNGKTQQASAYLKKSFYLSPSLLVIYNSAIMNWFEISDPTLSKAEKTKIDRAWRQQLKLFLEKSADLNLQKHDPELVHYRNIATALLLNDFEGQPDFYAPQ